MDNQKEKEEKIIKSIIPKITDYFADKSTLTKDKLQEFLDYIDLTFWNTEDEKEVLWKALTTNSNGNSVGKISVIKNLTDFIHSNGKDLFQPEKSLENSIRQLFSSQIQINYSNDINDYDEDTLYEFYKLLCVFKYNDNKSIILYEIEQYLKDYPFLNIKLEQVNELFEKITKQKVNEIGKDIYFNCMEHLDKNLKNKLIENTQGVKTFTDEELNEPELNYFNNLLDFSNIIYKCNESLVVINKKLIESQIQNDKILIEYYTKYFNCMISSIQVYTYEIQKLYNEQKQKFEYYHDRIGTKINMLKEDNNNLENKYKSLKEETEKNSKENLEKLYDELHDIKNQNDNLQNEIINLKKEIEEKKKNIMDYENKNDLLEKNKSDLEAKYNRLEKEKEILDNHYNKLLSEFNSKILKEQQEEERKKELQKNDLSQSQEMLVSMNKETLTSYMIERDNYCNQLEEINKNLKKQIENFEKNQEKIEKDFSELKSENATLKLQNDNLKDNNEQLNKDLDSYKTGKTNLLSNLLKDEEDFQGNGSNNLNNNNSIKLNKTQTFIKQNLTPIYIKFSYRKEPKKDINKISFDYLGLKLEETILQQLEDDYFNPNGTLCFSEYIKYLDQDKNQTECILFITQSFYYFFNKNSYEKCFSIPLKFLKTINASTNNNFISLTFENGEIVIFEIFRILEIIQFFKTLNVLQKDIQYTININNYNNQNFEKNKKKNYSNSPYYGKVNISGYLKKKYDNILQNSFSKRFVALTNLGLTIMDDPQGKPLEVINPLFAKIEEYNTKKGLCLELAIGKNRHIFSVSNDTLRKRWREEIEKWILNTYNDKIITI